MYPNHSYAGYHANTMGPWNQAAMPQNSQGIGYALPYAHPEVTTYVEKATFPTPYGAMYAAAENDYYRHSYAAPASQQPGQWTQTGFHQYMLAPQYRRSVTECYDRHRPNMPNTARPPPSMKTDNSDNTFHASLSMLENPTQNSAAAYTASWVSSTSSIPPELRDEPEVPSFNGSAHSGCRDDLAAGASAVFTPPVSTFADQFSNISIHEKDGETLTTHWEDPSLPAQQWPGLGQDGDGTCGPGGQGRRRRTDDRDRRARESPKELTWEERIRKGAVQKERVEQRGTERTERPDRDSRENSLGNGRPRGQRGGRYTVPTRCERVEREPILSPVLGEREANMYRNGQAVRTPTYRGGRVGDRGGHFDVGPRMMQMRAPPYYNHGVPLLMTRGTYYRPGPPLVCVPQQDQRFRNTWLDANLGLNYPSVHMVDYAFGPCGGYRSRPTSGGRGGYRYANKSSVSTKGSSKDKSHEEASCEADQDERMRSSVEQDELSKADEEENFKLENEEAEQSCNNSSFPREREKPENERGSSEKGDSLEGHKQCKVEGSVSSDEKANDAAPAASS